MPTSRGSRIRQRRASKLGETEVRAVLADCPYVGRKKRPASGAKVESAPGSGVDSSKFGSLMGQSRIELGLVLFRAAVGVGSADECYVGRNRGARDGP